MPALIQKNWTLRFQSVTNLMSLFSWFFLTCVFWFACQVPTINELEQRMHSLLRARAVRLLQRRQQDVRDQCQDYMTSLYFAPCFLSLVFKQMIDFQSSFKVSQGLSQEILACLYWCFPSPCVVDLNIKNVDSVATSPFFIFSDMFIYVYLFCVHLHIDSLIIFFSTCMYLPIHHL